MSDELRAAAERLRKSRSGHPEAVVYGVDPKDPYAYTKVSAAIVSDIRKTSDAYLAANPADDAELVDEDWLRSVGFEEDHLTGDLVISIERRGGHYDGLAWDGDGFTMTSTQLDLPGNTRGDARRLCTALGAELKEAGNGQA